MLTLDLPECGAAQVAVTLADGRRRPRRGRRRKTVGEKTVLANAIDPQGCLGAGRQAGAALAFAHVQRGNVPYLQVHKVNVTDPDGDARRAAKICARPPADAKWTHCADGRMSSTATSARSSSKNISRPGLTRFRAGSATTAGARGPSGYGKIAPPEPKLDKLAALQDGDQRLVTPQGAVFAPVGGDKNIAFTSLWDNWPRTVTVPVNKRGEASGCSSAAIPIPMQGRIANAVMRFRYADGQEERWNSSRP